jgi:filamentous hemagglutinin family protein
LLLATMALTSSPMIGPVLAQNLPTGGSVAAGSVTIAAPTSTQLNITQASQSAVVNWQSFSVGQGSAVNIQQPNNTSALLNRVTGDTPSSIAGSITSNGQVYLINPNGIAITSTGIVNTGGGFVASTLNISDADFQSGKRSFSGNGASAAVSNAGVITVGRGGYAALIGGSVSNSGSIFVPLGKVGLGSGERATLDFSGDGFLQVALPTSAGGSGPLISNSGTIAADGGSVIISAATAREAARDAVNMSGLVQARTIGGRSGSIIIGGGDGGGVKISGRLNAKARRTAGGTIAVTGKTIALKGATIDASGKLGGGTVNIGGGRQGQGPLQKAETVSIDTQSTIRADAKTSGNGGAVVVWSDQLTSFAGTISAQGGAVSGNGGEAEVSGKAKLDYTGFTNLSAINGAFGTLLLDPYNVIIANVDGTTGGSFDANVNDSIINIATLQTALGAANVTITTGTSGSQEGNITVASPLTWSAATTLGLNAAGAITVNAPITITGGGGLDLTATAQAGITTSGLTFGNGASIEYGAIDKGGTFRLNGDDYKLVYTMAQLDAIDGRNALNGTALTVYGTGVTGNYALATNLDAGGATYTRAIVADSLTLFGGKHDGLGHVVTDLTINATADRVGLVGFHSGTVSNIGVVGGSVSGRGKVGALVGVNNGTVQNSYAAGTTTKGTTGSGIGGLVGDGTGTVQASYATGTVTGGTYVGGLVGYGMGMTIKSSYATGNVTGTVNTGGLIGYVSGGAVENSYATGSVSGVDQVGGLVGTNGGTIRTSYATGVVTGATKVGGLIGSNGSSVVSSYWNAVTSGQSNGMGADSKDQSANVIAKTTADLQSGTLPAGFGALWAATAGANPYLAWQVAAAAPVPPPTPTPVATSGDVVPTAPPAADPGTMASTVTSTIQNSAAFYLTNFWPAETAGTGACCGVFYEDKRFGP